MEAIYIDLTNWYLPVSFNLLLYTVATLAGKVHHVDGPIGRQTLPSIAHLLQLTIDN